MGRDVSPVSAPLHTTIASVTNTSVPVAPVDPLPERQWQWLVTPPARTPTMKQFISNSKYNGFILSMYFHTPQTVLCKCNVMQLDRLLCHQYMALRLRQLTDCVGIRTSAVHACARSKPHAWHMVATEQQSPCARNSERGTPCLSALAMRANTRSASPACSDAFHFLQAYYNGWCMQHVAAWPFHAYLARPAKYFCEGEFCVSYQKMETSAPKPLRYGRELPFVP